MSEQLNLDRGGPFGIPDGHRAAIDDETFVALDPAVAQTGLVSSPQDRAARVVVGKKGSGKTVYLRRFQQSASKEDSVFAAQVDPTTPSTADVVRFCQWYGNDDLTERWSQAWRSAILRSVCSHLLYSPMLSDYGSPAFRRALEALARELMPEVRTPRSVQDQLSHLIAGHESGQHLERSLRDPEWGNLDYWIGELLRDAPPIFFYLDAVDEEYAAAPNYWLRCQKGLFYQVMRFLRDPIFGGRLHIVISVRDNVFASVLRSEHATRYRTDPHIRILAWDRPAIGYFLHQKLERLRPDHLMRPSRDPDVSAWLGTSKIRNERRGIVERLEDYLIRHTRMLPRDIVLLGNELDAEVLAAKRDGKRAVDAEHIRKVVSRVAAWGGREQLAICGNQVVGDSIPRGATDNRTIDSYVGNTAYQRQLSDRIGQIIRHLGTDQFDAEALETLELTGQELLGNGIDLPTVLWQNGLLGFGDVRLDDEEWIFHGIEDVDRFNPPLDRERYALHPCLLDALGFNGDGLGTQPVKPWRREAA